MLPPVAMKPRLPSAIGTAEPCASTVPSAGSTSASLTEQNKLVADSHLLGYVTELHGHVRSRIPNANDNDSLSSETLWILILSTMHVLSLKLLNSCKRRGNNYQLTVELISFDKLFFFFCDALSLSIYSPYAPPLFSCMIAVWNMFCLFPLPIASEQNLVTS